MLSENHELDLIKLTKIKPDKKSHISIKDSLICFTKCKDKVCTYFCPSKVYHWNGRRIIIEYSRCLECGASIMGCPYKNINWHYPQSGYGISHRF
ncbi:MAG: 4Fe-4S dicluster domain-containing protein [Bacillota bacterium]|nr:4Fe-4S dicluster domain-containing protein [Bacillota bacterium]